MNKKLNKNSSKELFIVGIASASVFLSGSGLALGETTARNSNQFFNNPTSLADSTVKSKEVLAQTTPEDNKPPSDVNPRENPPPPPAGSPTDNTRPSSGGPVSPPPPADAKPRGSTPPPTGASPTDSSSPRSASGPKPGTWACINNPNPVCRG